MMKILKVFFLTLFFPLVVFTQKPLTGRDTTIKGAQSFAIVVGISKYRFIRPLAYADKDAELFRNWLRSPAGGKLKEDNIFCLLNEEGSNANFWGKGFQWLKSKELARGDKLFIYLAGHGDAIDEDQYFFLGADCKPDGDKNNYLVSGAIQLFNLKKKIANETAKGVEVVFIMDACRSNELPGGTPGQNFLNTAISQKKAGEIMMLATGAGQVSLEDASIGNGNGLFTWYLVDGLMGVADAGNIDRRISFGELQSYVEKNVPTLALQQFRKKQEPFFCCTESSEKVISYVDTSYLQQWLNLKKQLERKGGSKAIPDHPFDGRNFADTLLVETYNRFHSAIKSNRLTGSGSAEDYYLQLINKFPNNPYTLDAASSLAVQFANNAQEKVNQYLDCNFDQSSHEKQENFEAALNLEKAYRIFLSIDEDFANSLRNRIYLLRSCGDVGPGGKNGNFTRALEDAHLARSLEPQGAYIHNRLAQIYLETVNRDSALFYANEAVKLAPNWPCALTTLSRARDLKPNTTAGKNQQKKVSTTGFFLGAGIIASAPTYQSNPSSSIINASSKTGETIEGGIFYYFPINEKFIFRPQLKIIFHQSTFIEFQRREQAGGPIITENVRQSEEIVGLSGYFIYKWGSRAYLITGPSAQYSLRKMNPLTSAFLLEKFSLLGDLGLGIDLGIKKMVLSPEFKFSHSFTDLNKPGTVYNSALSSLYRNSYQVSFYFRKK